MPRIYIPIKLVIESTQHSFDKMKLWQRRSFKYSANALLNPPSHKLSITASGRVNSGNVIKIGPVQEQQHHRLANI